MADGLDLAAFRSGVLRQWAGDTSPAFMAASEVMWLAAFKHTKGTVICHTPDSQGAKLVMSYLTDFCVDQEHLAQLRLKDVPDGKLVEGKVRILILPTGSSRRPRDVVATVEMPEAEAEKQQLSDTEKRDRLVHLFICIMSKQKNARKMTQEQKEKEVFHPTCWKLDEVEEKIAATEDYRKFVEIFEDFHAQKQAAKRKDMRPVFLHAGSSMEQYAKFVDLERTRIEPQTREERIVSHAYEVERAENIGKADMVPRHQPALTGPHPRWSRYRESG